MPEAHGVAVCERKTQDAEKSGVVSGFQMLFQERKQRETSGRVNQDNGEFTCLKQGQSRQAQQTVKRRIAQQHIGIADRIFHRIEL